MQTKKDYTLILLAIVFFIAALCSCKNDSELIYECPYKGRECPNFETCKGHEGEQLFFKNGQVLLPDYACTDTLIIVDAEGLNKAIECESDFIEGDEGIDSLFHIYCIIK
jgi:hypothetical protein